LNVSPSSHIGQYRILRKLGAGGMGMVFVGEHRLLHRRAAIKTLQPALSKQPDIVDRFFNEARALSAIGDPGIVQIFDFGYHVDGTAYIVMELLEGEVLADRLDRLGTLAIPCALRIARQMASSLAATHAKQIVHRDLKPENIFLVRDCEAQGGERTKILDFGICAVGGAPETDAPPGTMIGTPVYMAPEQCCGSVTDDPRSDIYGLGCVLFQMLTGRAPFERDSVRDVIQAHLVEPPPPPSSMREEVPPIVDELVRRCLAKAPEDRFASMTELGTEIEHVLARLSAPELPVFEAPPAVPLAAGYRSAYNANFAAQAGEDEAEAAPAASGSPVPAPSSSPSSSPPPLTFAPPPRYASLRKAALGIALLGGALLASLATRFTDGDGALASPSPPAAAAAVVPRPAPDAARAGEAAPTPAKVTGATPARGPAVAAVAATPRAADKSGPTARSASRARPSRKMVAQAPAIQRPTPAARPPAAPSTAAAAPSPAPSPASPAAAPAASPRPEASRPPAAPPAAPAQATSEDLYDTR
jgi:serine/threonine-protein kinase